MAFNDPGTGYVKRESIELASQTAGRRWQSRHICFWLIFHARKSREDRQTDACRCLDWERGGYANEISNGCVL